MNEYMQNNQHLCKSQKMKEESKFFREYYALLLAKQEKEDKSILNLTLFPPGLLRRFILIAADYSPAFSSFHTAP